MLTNLLWRLSRRKTGLSRWLRDEASIYLDFFNDFERNGEAKVVQVLSARPVSTVLDVGANLGEWSLMASRAFPSATIHAFELSERTRATLRKNLSGPRFVVPDVALGRHEAEIEYKDYGDGSTVNTIVDTTFHDSARPFELRRARLIAGDTYLESTGIQRVDLLKIDVEGAELLVLEGFGCSLKQRLIRAIQFEYGYANGDAGHLMRDFHTLLEGAGYVVGKIWTAGVRFSPFEYRFNNFDSGPNFLAVSGDDKELIAALRSSA